MADEACSAVLNCQFVVCSSFAHIAEWLLCLLCRLYLMLAAVTGLPDRIVEYGSRLSPAQRASSLAAFRLGTVKVLVASDAMARGMDVSNVVNVINYDAPVYPKVYVHRAGRTARAGRLGCVYTLLRREDMYHFKSMLKKIECGSMKVLRFSQEQLEQHAQALQAALQQTQELLETESSQQDKLKGNRRHRPGTAVQAMAGQNSKHGGASSNHDGEANKITTDDADAEMHAGPVHGLQPTALTPPFKLDDVESTDAADCRRPQQRGQTDNAAGPSVGVTNTADHDPNKLAAKVQSSTNNNPLIKRRNQDASNDDSLEQGKMLQRHRKRLIT